MQYEKQLSLQIKIINNMKKILFQIAVFALSALLITGCSKDDNGSSNSGEKPDDSLETLLKDEWKVTELDVEGDIDAGLFTIKYILEAKDINLKATFNSNDNTFTYSGSYNAEIKATLATEVLFSEEELFVENAKGTFVIISENKFKFINEDNDEIEYEVISKSRNMLKVRTTTDFDDLLDEDDDDDDDDFDFDLFDGATLIRTETWTR